MKSILKFSSSFLSILILTIGLSFGQESKIDNIPVGRYLVIGSFHIKQNAVGFSEYVKRMDQYEVKLAFHPVTKFYHVYIKGYPENKNGYADVKKFRRQTEFIDVWFYVVKPYGVGADSKTEQAQLDEKKEHDESSGWIRAKSPSDTEEETAADSLAAVSLWCLVRPSCSRKSF